MTKAEEVMHALRELRPGDAAIYTGNAIKGNIRCVVEQIYEDGIIARVRFEDSLNYALSEVRNLRHDDGC